MDEVCAQQGWTVLDQRSGNCDYGTFVSLVIDDPHFPVVRRWFLVGDLVQGLHVTWISHDESAALVAEVDAIARSAHVAEHAFIFLRESIRVSRDLAAAGNTLHPRYFVVEDDFRLRSVELPIFPGAEMLDDVLVAIRGDRANRTARAIVLVARAPLFSAGLFKEVCFLGEFRTRVRRMAARSPLGDSVGPGSIGRAEFVNSFPDPFAHVGAFLLPAE